MTIGLLATRVRQRMLASTPSFTEYTPATIPFQARFFTDAEHHIDWSLGVHEFLFSGSVGSAKSIAAAHWAVKHCLKHPFARVLLARRAMPDLRDTIFTKIAEHIEGSRWANGRLWVAGRDYDIARNTCRIVFPNRSEIISRSWADKNFKKLGSLEISGCIFEEAAENDAEDYEAAEWIRMRLGRQPHVPRSWLIICTNPDGPSHPIYSEFELDACEDGGQPRHPQRHVYFSDTRDNPYLPKSYIRQLQENMDPMLAKRMIEGKWVDIRQDVVYHQYGAHNKRHGEVYAVDPKYPIRLCFDFNIGEGKPMSACAFQAFKRGEHDEAHFFFESIVMGADTMEQMEEIAGRGLFNLPVPFVVHGDASGASRDTKSKTSDYDLIKKFLANYRRPDGSRLDWRIDVPLSNPPVRTRHNLVNAYCRNAHGRSRLFVYDTAKTVDKGLRLTALRKGGSYIEDDSKPYQHVTTALGYGLFCYHETKESKTGFKLRPIR